MSNDGAAVEAISTAIATCGPFRDKTIADMARGVLTAIRDGRISGICDDAYQDTMARNRMEDEIADLKARLHKESQMRGNAEAALKRAETEIEGYQIHFDGAEEAYDAWVKATAALDEERKENVRLKTLLTKAEADLASERESDAKYVGELVHRTMEQLLKEMSDRGMDTTQALVRNNRALALEKEVENLKARIADFARHTDRAQVMLSCKHLGKNVLQGALDEIDDLKARLEKAEAERDDLNRQLEISEWFRERLEEAALFEAKETIAERDAAIGERDALARTVDDREKELHAADEERDAAIRERDEARKDAACAIRALDDERKLNKAINAEADAAIRERDEALVELAREKLLREEAHKHERKAWDAANRLVGLLKEVQPYIKPGLPADCECECCALWRRIDAEIGEKP